MDISPLNSCHSSLVLLLRVLLLHLRLHCLPLAHIIDDHPRLPLLLGSSLAQRAYQLGVQVKARLQGFVCVGSVNNKGCVQGGGISTGKARLM